MEHAIRQDQEQCDRDTKEMITPRGGTAIGWNMLPLSLTLDASSHAGASELISNREHLFKKTKNQVPGCMM